MKIKIISVALLAVLSTTAVSCQKDTVMDNVPVPIVSEVHTMQYAVNPFSRMFRHYVGGVVLDLQSSTGYYKDLQSSYIHNLS